MWLIAIYLMLMIVGDLLDYLIVGYLIEPVWPAAGLTLFLGFYFAFLWLAWILAVWLTEPKKAGAGVRTR